MNFRNSLPIYANKANGISFLFFFFFSNYTEYEGLFQKRVHFLKPGYTDALNLTLPSAKIGYIILRNARNNLIF